MIHEFERARPPRRIDREALFDEIDAQFAELVRLRKWRMLRGDADVVHDRPVSPQINTCLFQSKGMGLAKPGKRTIRCPSGSTVSFRWRTRARRIPWTRCPSHRVDHWYRF